MSIGASQQAAKEVNATANLLGFPPSQQISKEDIQKLPNHPELIPGLNLENVSRNLSGQPQNDTFQRQ